MYFTESRQSIEEHGRRDSSTARVRGVSRGEGACEERKENEVGKHEKERTCGYVEESAEHRRERDGDG